LKPICNRILFSDSIASTMRTTIWITTAILIAGSGIYVLGQAGQAPGAGRAQSQASQRPPQTSTAQTYPTEQIQAGQTRFSSQCGFCHGRDAAGGETGPDLTRSVLVAQDVRGDKILPVLRAGRLDKGMPAFDLGDVDQAAIVAYIHDQKTKGESLGGGRRSVDVSDLQTGNADAGKLYFNGAGGCAKCHSATGDMAGIGTRLQGLALLERMLYPTGRPAPAPAKVVVTLPSGEIVSGTLVSRDEFTITLKDVSGMNRSWAAGDVKYSIDDPLNAHFDLLEKYTDTDMHNVHAFLQTLRQEN
jgi:cytochrome c oxidase cbb3-type subunit 3